MKEWILAACKWKDRGLPLTTTWCCVRMRPWHLTPKRAWWHLPARSPVWTAGESRLWSHAHTPGMQLPLCICYMQNIEAFAQKHSEKKKKNKIIFHHICGKLVVSVLFCSVMYCRLLALKSCKGSHAPLKFFMLRSINTHAMPGHPQSSFHSSVACGPLCPLGITASFLTHWKNPVGFNEANTFFWCLCHR